MTREQFIGTWKLIASTMKNSTGEEIFPLGKDPVGYLMYDGNGYMAALLMKADRPHIHSSDMTGGTDEEIAEAGRSHISYCGTYHVGEDKVIHHVLVSSYPNWVGGDQERFFKFDNNHLILSTPPTKISGEEIVGQLTWERVQSETK